jgi:hypothetical protein
MTTHPHSPALEFTVVDDEQDRAYEAIRRAAHPGA